MKQYVVGGLSPAVSNSNFAVQLNRSSMVFEALDDLYKIRITYYLYMNSDICRLLEKTLIWNIQHKLSDITTECSIYFYWTFEICSN